MFEVAKTYFSYGLSIIPVDASKIPIGSWKPNTEQLINPELINGFKQAFHGIGVVAGKVSGGLEIVDIDCKYDLTGTLFNDYKLAITAIDPNLLKKLVVQKTANGGYHFIYRCSVIEGNKKLARREATPEEQANKEKVKVLIETRGEGGYIMIAPSPQYSLLYGSLDKISTITPEERETLLNCAKTFNQEKVVLREEKKEIVFNSENSPFEEFNENGDILPYLIAAGWKEKGMRGRNVMLLRPGGDKKWSADYSLDKKIFYVFTQSSEFECDKGYNNSQILATLKFGGNFAETAKFLKEQGYGKQSFVFKKPEIKDDCSFLSKPEKSKSYLDSVRDGSFQLGKQTNIPDLDRHFRLKEANLVIINGMDNVGKSTVIWYIMVLAALFYDWTFGMLCAENNAGGIRRKLMEFYLHKELKAMTDEEYAQALKWVNEHFFIIENDELYEYGEVLKMGNVLVDKYKIKYLLVDPYNALLRDSANYHEHDYKAASEMRLFIKKTGCGIYLNCHAVTTSLRKEYPKGHKYEGYPFPPSKADTEGGGKFGNKADDFLTLHRLTQHPTDWTLMQIHVRKIKEMETGGRPTTLDAPVLLEMVDGGVGFKSVETKVDPIWDYWAVQKYAGKQKKVELPESAGNDIITGNSEEGMPF